MTIQPAKVTDSGSTVKLPKSPLSIVSLKASLTASTLKSLSGVKTASYSTMTLPSLQKG